MGSFIQAGKYFNSNILYTCEAFCLWLYFLQSKLQFRNKFFCTLAKNPLSPLETNSSFFSFSITFGDIYKAIKFSPAVFFLVITFLFFNPSDIYSQHLYARWVPGSKEIKMQSNTELSLSTPQTQCSEPDQAPCNLPETTQTTPLPHVPHLTHPYRQSHPGSPPPPAAHPLLWPNSPPMVPLGLQSQHPFCFLSPPFHTCFYCGKTHVTERLPFGPF